MGQLVDQLHASIPGVTIIVGNLLPRTDAELERKTQVYNAGLPAVIQDRQSKGVKVTWVDFHSSYFSVNDLFDGYVEVA